MLSARPAAGYCTDISVQWKNPEETQVPNPTGQSSLPATLDNAGSTDLHSFGT